MRRAPSLQDTPTGIDRDIDSKYDNVKIVADNIDSVVDAGNNVDILLKNLGTAVNPPPTRVDGSPIEDGDYYLDPTTKSFFYYLEGTGEWVESDTSSVAAFAEASRLSAEAAELSATNAASSESLVESYKTAAEASAQSAADSEAVTVSNAEATSLDVLATNADVITTQADAARTSDDAINTASDRQATGQDRVQTGEDVVSTASSALAASVSAGNASDSESVVEQYKNDALTSRDEAEEFKDSALESKNLSRDWAEKADNTDVDGIGTRSAKHQANRAEISANITESNVTITNADVVKTNADVVSTGLDVVQTGEDVLATNADVLLSNANVVKTNADVVLTGADVTATNSNVLLTNADVLSTNTNASNSSDSEIAAKASENATKTSEGNAAISEGNAATSESNAATSEGNALNYANLAETSKELSVTASEVAVAHANFDGLWVNAGTKSVVIPYSVEHVDAIWMLVKDGGLTDVSSSEPSVGNMDWSQIGSTGGTATDAARLGGNLPSHYAKQSDMDSVQTTLPNKVDSSRLLTDVPENAVFTDTTYSNLSEFANDVGYITSYTDTQRTDQEIKDVIATVGYSTTDTIYDDTDVYNELAGKATSAQGAVADSAIQPGDNVSELVNDAGFITSADVPDSAVVSVNGESGIVVLDKGDIGLDQVDNTSDTNKPVSTATQAALDGKVDDSQVQTDVPSGALFTDTVYVHPVNHPASIITQDANNRFVTDAEKASWNAGGAAEFVIPFTSSGTFVAGGAENQMRDSGSFDMPLASTVDANVVCIATLPDTFGTSRPTINTSGGDLFRNAEGTDNLVNVLGSVMLIFTSNGIDEWAVDVVSGSKGADGISTPTEIVSDFPSTPVEGTLYIKIV